MAKTITILGATGNQGGSVAGKFLSLGWRVVGTTRSSTSSSALALKAKGVIIVEANQDDSASLIKAFSGAHVSDRATGEHALEIEVNRGKRIVDAVAKVLDDEGVLERFVLSTLPGFKELSGGKYTYAYHFDGKAEISKYLRGKKELWGKSSFLNMGFYTTNLMKMGTKIGFTKDEESGKFIMRKPGGNSVIHPFVDTRDAGAFVELLVNSPPRQDLLAVSEMSSYETFMKILTEVSGKPCETPEITIEEADKALPGGLGREVAESGAASAEFGWGKHTVMPTDLDPNVKLTSLRAYVEGEDWAALFNKM